MKWHTESIDDYQKRLSSWRRFFAWYPVYCWETNNIVWLEYVKRKVTMFKTDPEGDHITYWEYREIR